MHFWNWFLNGTLPPDSVYPTLNGKKGDWITDAGHEHSRPCRQQAGNDFPALPGLRFTLPDPSLIVPVLAYGWGPPFNYTDASGIPTNAPLPNEQVFTMLAPRVDADGGKIGGVPVVLTDAPLGTCLGRIVTAEGAKPFHQGQICNYAGSVVPFAGRLCNA